MEAGRNYCRMAMRTGLGSLRGFSCEVLEGLTGNSESAAFSTSTCWPTGCGNRLQGTKRLSLFILPFGGEGECLEFGSRVHAQMSSETFSVADGGGGRRKGPRDGLSSPPRRCIFFFTRGARIFFVSPPTTHHPPPGISISDMHRLLLHVDSGGLQGLWSVR